MNLTEPDADRDKLCLSLLKRLYLDNDDVAERHIINLRILAAARLKQEFTVLERSNYPVSTCPRIRMKLFTAIKKIASDGEEYGTFKNTRAAIVYIFNVFWASYSKPVPEQEKMQTEALQYLEDTYPIIEMRHYEIPLPGGQYE